MIKNLKYIIVDDDPFNNMICSMVIKNTLGITDITVFTIPEDGLSYIKENYSNIFGPTVLFLDLDMPTITGWEFLEEYDKFDDNIKKQIIIYIVSSSVDQRDKDKAAANPNVKDFISKPLSKEILLSISEHTHAT